MMISELYAVNQETIKRLEKLRSDDLYLTYFKAVSASPLYSAIRSMHIRGINIKDDLLKLKNAGVLPKNVNEDVARAVYELFYEFVLPKIICDIMIIKDLAEKDINDVINDVSKDGDLLYILGMADESLYVMAKEKIDNGEVAKNSAIAIGYYAYLKINKINPEIKISGEIQKDRKKEKKAKEDLKEVASLGILSKDNIEL